MHWIINKNLLKTQDTNLVYLKHKGVIELWVAALAPGLGLTMVSIFRWQQLQFDQCGIALALCWQVSSLKQGNHQLLLFLLILHSKTQAYSGATGLCPLTWLFRKLVQIWPQAAQWEPASSNRKSERECKWSRETKIKKKNENGENPII